MKPDVAAIQSTVDKLGKSIRAFPRNPNPRKVHKLRTRVHRFQSQERTLPLVAKDHRPGLEKALRKIRKKAGKVRDFDVFAS